ncbi:MAG: hypothetical protein QGD92_03835 [Gammaproteobacteria bacterium]|nr:hypothetical protein [Gammaproteobacteria bacterium]
MFNFLKRWQAQSRSEPFLSLMVVASEDEAMQQHLLAILRQNSFNRHSLLNTWIAELILQSAPESFTRALGFLLDDEVAERALAVLESQHH